ncbi:MAG: heavy-metal-associated domain-containing protein [Candidatus Dormibacteria bacterium]|nr:MAG: hypothetical protein B7Z69_08465 [Actinobacteria bacterium 21-73-9]HQU33957.1 cation transporter [Thermoanaerobaculaceae bacterium]
MTTLDLVADDISCGHCKASIESDLGQRPGVHGVEVDIDTRTIHVTYDEDQTSTEAIKAILAEIGYPAT